MKDEALLCPPQVGSAHEISLADAGGSVLTRSNDVKDQSVSWFVFNHNTEVVNRRAEKETTYIGRGSMWGNPFAIGSQTEHGPATREDVIRMFARMISTDSYMLGRLFLLNGHKLGCYCKPQACHGDILLRLLKGLEKMCRLLNCPPSDIKWDRTQSRMLFAYAGLESFLV